MLIPVTFSSYSSSSSNTQKLPPSLAKISHDEVVLLDLQGTLEIDSSHPTERDGKLIGTLSIDNDLKRIALRIGHHLIEGKLVNLPKPLAILHRSQASACTSESQWTNEGNEKDEDVLMDGQEKTIATAKFSGAQWNTMAIVKRKILFSKRPTPIVGG
ncbi:chromosome transmission fidelity protein 8 [Lentinula aciculospora]|uniref:Chromosome transmission fidelity protein 8 n=1 Tax=Lentinula aciculospora TaxID=153920 RepID=A0A9W9AA77_9AGAR|nr:chromosome transmission fidelity protein 8 [Lentinula aciculospora]